MLFAAENAKASPPIPPFQHSPPKAVDDAPAAPFALHDAVAAASPPDGVAVTTADDPPGPPWAVAEAETELASIALPLTVAMAFPPAPAVPQINVVGST